MMHSHGSKMDLMRSALVTLLALHFVIHVNVSIAPLDPDITLSVPGDVTEGMDSSVTLTVTASTGFTADDLTATVTVDTNIANTQAAPGYDFGGTGSYTATIPVGSTTADIVIAIENDDLAEPTEAVMMGLSAVTGGDGSPNIGTPSTVSFNIIDNGDSSKVQINFAESTYEENEGGAVTLQLEFTDSTGQPTVINGGTITADPTLLRTASLDTATLSTDYSDPTGNTVSFTFDLTTTSTTVTAINLVDDASAEPTEIFYVSLGPLSDGTYTELGTLVPVTAVRIHDGDTESLICLAATPETRRSSRANFVFYAFTSLSSGQASIAWDKSDLPSAFANFNNEGTNGKLLTVSAPGKTTKRRFGAYTLTATDSGGSTLTCKTYIKARSNILNDPASMAKKYTLIIYPSTDGGTTLSPAVTFGVNYRDPRRRNNLVWRKDGSRLENTMSTLHITDTAAAGVYEISRSIRGKKGWFTIMEVIASECPSGMHKNGGSSCNTACETCYNGGVCDTKNGNCICPPCFEGKNCELVVTTFGTFGATERFSCSSLGLDSTCKGVLFSNERNYGSKCGCGWSGTDCQTECDEGTFGADCEQTCHCMTSAACDVRTGKCTDGLGCETGYTGDNCQILG